MTQISPDTSIVYYQGKMNCSIFSITNKRHTDDADADGVVGDDDGDDDCGDNVGGDDCDGDADRASDGDEMVMMVMTVVIVMMVLIIVMMVIALVMMVIKMVMVTRMKLVRSMVMMVTVTAMVMVMVAIIIVVMVMMMTMTMIMIMMMVIVVQYSISHTTRLCNPYSKGIETCGSSNWIL